jgi:hypothetical protein
MGMNLLIGVVLIVHGLIVAGQAMPGAWISNPSWLWWWPTAFGQSWLLHALRLERAPWTWLSSGVWLVGGMLLVAAGLAALGVVVPLWRSLAITGAIVSLTMLLTYWHPFATLGLALSAGILITVGWAAWPPPHLIGA